jgi:hypothetical protein
MNDEPFEALVAAADEKHADYDGRKCSRIWKGVETSANG